MRKILSIDWDFFFPDLSHFDWGMSEHHSEALSKIIWATRYSNINYLTKDIASELKPNYGGFWQKIKCNNSIREIVIADSHADILNYIDQHHDCEVWNIDQHHDCGYRKQKPLLSCEDWALHKNVKMYNLIYPKWRLNVAERTPKRDLNIFYVDDHFSFADNFDIAFICRSSAWAPPWCDHHWREFLADLEREFPLAYRDQKTIIDNADQARVFDFRVAQSFGAQIQNMRKKKI